MPMDYTQLGQMVKQKYPQYASTPDDVVGQKVAAKYPQYQQMVNAPAQTPDTIPTAPPQQSQNPVVSGLEKIGSGAANLLFPGVQAGGRAIGNVISNEMTKGQTAQEQQQEQQGQQSLLNDALTYQKRGDTANAQRMFGLMRNRTQQNTGNLNQQLQAATQGRGDAIRGAIGTGLALASFAGPKGGIPGITGSAGLVNAGENAGLGARVGAGILNMLPANIIRGGLAGAATDKSTAGSTLKTAGTSAVIGSALEALTQGVFPALGGAFNWTKQSLNTPADAIQKQLANIPQAGQIAQVGQDVLNDPLNLPGATDATVADLVHPTDPTETAANLDQALKDLNEQKASALTSAPATAEHAQQFQSVLQQIKDASMNAPDQATRIKLDNLSHDLQGIYTPQPVSGAEAVTQSGNELSNMLASVGIGDKAAPGMFEAPPAAYPVGASELPANVSAGNTAWTAGGTLDNPQPLTQVAPETPVPAVGAATTAEPAIDQSLPKIPVAQQIALQQQAQQTLSGPQDTASLTQLDQARQKLGDYFFGQNQSPELKQIYFNLRDYIQGATGNSEDAKAVDDSIQSVYTAKNGLSDYLSSVRGKAGATIPQAITDPEAVRAAIMNKPVPNAFAQVAGPIVGGAAGVAGLGALASAGAIPATAGVTGGFFLGNRLTRGLFENPQVIMSLSNLLNQASDTAGPAVSAATSPALSRLLGPLLSAQIMGQQQQQTQQ